MPAPPLVVSLEANLQKFDEGMRQAGDMVVKKVGEIERAFADANPKLNSERFTASLAALTGGAAAVGISKLIDSLVEANKQLATMEETSKRIGLSLGRFQELRFAANVAGVSDKSFASSLEAIASRLNDVRHGETELSKWLTANNVKYRERNGEIISTEKGLMAAVDLIRRAATEQDKIKVAEKFGIDREMIPLLEQGADKIEAMTMKARQLGVVIDEDTIKKAQKFTIEWNAATTTWSANFRAALADIIPLLNQIINGAAFLTSLGGTASGIIGGFGRVLAGGFEGLNIQDLERMERDLQNTLTRPSVKGNARIPADYGEGNAFENLTIVQERLAQLRRDAERPPGERITINRRKPGEAATVFPQTGSGGTETDAFDREIERIKRRIALQEAEGASIGKTAGEHEKLRNELLLLNAAGKEDTNITAEKINLYAKLRATMSQDQALAAANIKLTGDQAEAFRKYTELSSGVVEANRRMKDSFQGLNDSAKFAGNQIVDAIDGLINKTRTLAESGRAALQAFTKELLRAAITGEGAFSKLLGTNAATPGGTGGILGLFTGAFSFGKVGAGVSTSAQLDQGGSLLGFADGGRPPVGRPSWVGERGRELFVPDVPGTIIPNNVVGDAGRRSMNVTYNIDASGADQAAIARLERVLVAQSKQLANTNKAMISAQRFQVTGVM